MVAGAPHGSILGFPQLWGRRGLVVTQHYRHKLISHPHAPLKMLILSFPCVFAHFA